MTFDQADKCCGASGHKLRTVCVWCPRYWKYHGIKMKGETTMGDMASAERIEKLEEKIDSMWNKVMEMAQNLAVMATKLENMTRDTNDIKRDVDDIKTTPKNRWNAVINTIITISVTAFFTYLVLKAKEGV